MENVRTPKKNNIKERKNTTINHFAGWLGGFRFRVQSLNSNILFSVQTRDGNKMCADFIPHLSRCPLPPQSQQLQMISI
jgi:hypothetical protein